MNRYARSFLGACLLLIFPALARADWNQIYLSAGVGADALTDDGRISPSNQKGHASYGGPVGGDVGWEGAATAPAAATGAPLRIVLDDHVTDLVTLEGAAA